MGSLCYDVSKPSSSLVFKILNRADTVSDRNRSHFFQTLLSKEDPAGDAAIDLAVQKERASAEKGKQVSSFAMESGQESRAK